MLKKRLSSWNAVVRSGWPVARLAAAGRSDRTHGRAERTNGRIWFFTSGAASLTNGSTWWLALSICWKTGPSFVRAGFITCASVLTLTSVFDVWLSAPGSLLIVLAMLRFSTEIGRAHV